MCFIYYLDSNSCDDSILRSLSNNFFEKLPTIKLYFKPINKETDFPCN